MYVLSDLKEHTRHTCILADRYILAVRDLKVLDDIVQDTLSDLSVLTGTAVTDRTFYISRKMIVGIDAESLDYITLISRMEVNSFPDYKVDTFQAALRDSLILVVIFSVRLAPFAKPHLTVLTAAAPLLCSFAGALLIHGATGSFMISANRSALCAPTILS